MSGSGRPPRRWEQGDWRQGRWSGWNGWGGERPPWWPEDQQWPPRGAEEWGRRGRQAARWIGCAVGVVLLLVAGAVVGLIYLVLSAVGVVGSAPLGRVPAGLALLVAVLAVIIAAGALRRVARPATQLVDAARRIEAGDYSARVSVRGPRQLRSLARAFNEMSSRLEAEDARRQSVVADVAHELRTPLTVIRGQTEAIIDGVYPATPDRLKPILAATDTLETLIDDLRTMAMTEAGSLQLHREPTDVALLVNGTVDGFRGAASEQGVSLTADVAIPAPVIDADPVRIGSVLRNLLTNALRHTPRGGAVRVSVARTPGDHQVRLTVADDGDGMPDDLLPRVFDRFVKGPGSPGSGLGLAIVRDIVEAHGGTVAARNNPTRGATFDVTLPEVAPADAAR